MRELLSQVIYLKHWYYKNQPISYPWFFLYKVFFVWISPKTSIFFPAAFLCCFLKASGEFLSFPFFRLTVGGEIAVCVLLSLKQHCLSLSVETLEPLSWWNNSYLPCSPDKGETERSRSWGCSACQRWCRAALCRCFCLVNNNVIKEKSADSVPWSAQRSHLACPQWTC